MTSPMNGAALLGLCACLLALARPEQGGAAAEAWSLRADGKWAFGIASAVVLAMAPSRSMGFIADDYAHLYSVSRAGGAEIAAWFTEPAPDLHYRPAGMLWYWLEWHWAGFTEWMWQLGGGSLNAINAALWFAICRELGLARRWAAMAALLFGLHGARPEAVSWVAARFDLLATLAVFAALWLFLRTGAKCSAARTMSMGLIALTGMLSKESAFVLPGLLLAVLWMQPERRNPGAWRLAGASAAAAAVALACRLAVLGGIGGYQTDAGTPTVLDWKPWLFFKAIALRLPAVLTVPINWTGGLSVWLCVSLTAMVAALLLLVLRSRSSREARLGALLALISVLPVYHLLQIVDDLERARVLYLAAAGFGLFLAALLQKAERRLAVACAAALLVFHLSALWHNIGHWQRMSVLHRQTCRAVANYAGSAGPALYAAELPTTVDGIYMLTTGLPECVALRHGVARERVKLVDLPSGVPADAVEGAIRWNPTRREVERINRE